MCSSDLLRFGQRHQSLALTSAQSHPAIRPILASAKISFTTLAARAALNFRNLNQTQVQRNPAAQGNSFKSARDGVMVFCGAIPNQHFPILFCGMRGQEGTCAYNRSRNRFQTSPCYFSHRAAIFKINFLISSPIFEIHR